MSYIPPQGIGQIVKAIKGTQPRDVVQWGGVSLTGRDVSKDLERLPDIDGKLGDIRGALESVAVDKFRTSVIDALPVGDNWIGRVKIGDGTRAVQVNQIDPRFPLQVDDRTRFVDRKLIGSGTLDAPASFYWEDDTVYEITETEWTAKSMCRIHMHTLGFGAILDGVYIKAYVSTTGEELLVRVRNEEGNILASEKWTETTATVRYLHFVRFFKFYHF